MSTSIQIPVTQIGLEQSIVQGVRNASKKANLSLGGLGSGAAQKINAISQPLGRITGQADEFSKSMAAANARVLAFGASAGIMAGVSAALAGVVKSAINVEQKLSSINTVLQTTSAQLEKFGDSIFSIAKNTGQSFDIVAEGALELARQGLSAADTLSRLNDALILSRLSGLDAAKSVEGLTAAYNSFQGAGETTATILNKLVVVSQKYAVSERDLIEGVKRSASVAELAGVSFNELLGVITAVQQKTARGGAVIGNSFKTIFARIQDKGVLTDLQDLGVEVTDASKEILPATKILGNLAQQFGQLSKIQQTDLAKKLGGIYQLDKLLAGLEDLSSANSVARDAEKKAAGAREEAYEKNLLLNQTLAEVINRVTINAQELGAKLGALGVTDSLKNILSFFNNLLEGVQNLLGEESGLGKFVRGIVRGISEIVTGPGLALFAAIIVKLSKDLVVFGAQSLKSFFGIGKAAKDIKDLETSIKSALASNVDLQEQILKLGNDRYSQMKLITAEIQKQEVAQRTLQKISSDLSNPAYKIGIRAGEQGLRVNPPKNTAAEGYIPAVSKEKQNIQKGVGGAKSGDKPVTLENFNFGGGKKGSIVAHTGEYIVPNFGGGSGSAIFNRDMVRKMGLPSGAKKINAAGGFIPNFVSKSREIGSGLQGTFYRLGNKDGVEVGVKKFVKDGFSQAAQAEWLVAEYLSKYVKIPAVFGPKNLSKFQDSIRKKAIRKEVVSDQLARNAVGGDVARMFGSTVLFNALKTQGLSIGDLHGSNYTVNESAAKEIRELKNYPQDATGALSVLKQMASKGARIGIIDAGLTKVSDPARSIIGSILQKESQQAKTAAGGFIPNFAEKYKKGGDRTLEDARVYFGKQKVETAIAAFENPNTSENNLLAAAERLAKAKSMTYNFNASKLKFDGAKGIGLVALQDNGIGDNGMGKLTSDSPDIQKILQEIGVPDLSKVLESKFRARNIDPKLFQGVKADVLQAKPNIAFENIKISSVNALKDQFSSDTFKDFQQTVNRLFARPISDLGNELFGSALGNLPSGDVSDKYIFGKDVLGSIFESATQFYIKGANSLPSFQEGEGNRNQRFDFPMTDAEEAKRLNSLFFKKGGVGIAEAKLTANSSTLNSIVSKGLNDKRVIKAMKTQIADESKISMAGGFIPNFFEEGRVPEKIRQGLDFESDIFQGLGLKNPGNRNLDFPPKLLNQPGLEEGKFDMGIQGSYGDVKLTGAESNKRNFLGKLIRHFDLSQYIIESFRSGGVNSISLDKRTPKIKEATMFFEGPRNLFYPEEVSATLGQILKESRISKETASPLLEAFASARTNSGVKNSVALQDVFKRKRITAKIKMDGVSPYADLFDKSDALDVNAGIDEDNPFARGFIPNFANSLKEAIDREMEAGVPASQIYIDKNSSLKNAMNPMGLMVANRRDEPAGGIQGINRARKEGVDPMMYGAAYGLIPNFAKNPKNPKQTAPGQGTLQLGGSATAPASTPNQSTAQTQGVVAAGVAVANVATATTKALPPLIVALNDFKTEVEKLIPSLNAQIQAGKITRQEAGQQIENLAASKLKGVGLTERGVQKQVGRAAEKLVPDAAPKAMSDFVGKLFLLQSVASGVSAAFSELGKVGEDLGQGFTSLTAGALSFREFFNMNKSTKAELAQGAAGRDLVKNVASAKPADRQAALKALEAGIDAGQIGTPGKDSYTARLARRSASTPKAGANIASRAWSATGRGASRGLLSVITKVGPLFGRMIPIVGQVITGFQIVGGLFKMFGFDLNKFLIDGLTKLGQSLGIVATDAEKLSKSFQKNSKEIASSLNTGKVEKGTSAFQKTIGEALKKASEKEIVSKLRDETERADEDNASANYTNQLLDDEVFRKNKEFFAQRAGLSQEDLQKQFEKEGLGGLQKERTTYGAISMGTAYQGLSQPQADAIATLEKDLIGQFSSAETQKAFGEAVASGDFKKQKLLIEQLSEEAEKKLTELGKSDDVKKLRTEIADSGDLNDAESLRKANQAINSLLKDSVKAEEVQKQLNLVDLQIAQQKLDNLIKYKTALLDIPSIQENSLSIEKELINTTDARKVSIERELTARKAAIDLTKQQTDAAAAFLKDQGAIQAILQKAGIDKATEESFREVASIVEGVSDQIRLQGGYTDDVAKSTEELLQSKLKNKEAVERISELLKGQMTALSDQQQIQLTIQDIELKRNAIVEARTSLMKMERDSQIQSLDLIKEEVSQAEKLEGIRAKSFQTRANALKEVAPRSMQFEIDALQNIRDRASARSQANNQQKTIFRDLQKDLLSSALEKKFTSLAEEISNATELKELKDFDKKFANAEKQAAIKKLNAAFDEQKIQLKTAGLFNDIIIDAANQFAKTINPGFKTIDERVAAKSSELLEAQSKNSGNQPKLQQELNDLMVQQDALKKAQSTISGLEAEKQNQLTTTSIVSAEFVKIKQAFNNNEAAAQQFLVSLEELDFTLKAASIQLEKRFAELMLSFSNQIAEERRKNIALAGQIERTGMIRDFENENPDNFRGITDPQEYLKRQQSITAEYFSKIQALEVDKANRELEMQFKTEQMTLDNIRQLVLNTEALRDLRDRLIRDPDVQKELQDPNTVASIKKETPQLFELLRKIGLVESDTTSSASEKMMLDASLAPEKIDQMRDAAFAISKSQEDPVAASRQAAERIFGLTEDVDGFSKSILDLVNGFKDIQANSKEAIKTSELGQRITRQQAQPRNFSEGVDEGFRQLNKRREEFAFQFGTEIPMMFSNGLSQALNSAIEGAASLKDALRSAAYEFVKGLNQRIMGQLMDNLVSRFKPSALAESMGSVKSMFTPYSTGGKVSGGSGSKDDVPAMLMGGEYVVNKRAVAKYGPQFLEAINNGTLAGYAKGGKIQKGPQGNFYTPGTFGQGAIEGKRNLLDFATQTGTSGKFDQIINESGYQAISLEPESSRLSVSGMRNSPMFDATQSAKGQAFDLYLQQYNAERQAKKQEKEQKKALMMQLGMMALSAALVPVIGAAGAGAKAAFGAAKAGGATMGQSLLAGAKGIFTGGQVLGKQVGGLNNLFSGVGKGLTGNFTGAANQFKLSQISNDKQLISLMQSDPKFAGYIGGMDGLDFSGVKRATIVPEPGRFSATKPNASIPIGQARTNYGVPYTGNTIDLGPPPADSRPSKYTTGWSKRISSGNAPGVLPSKQFAIGGMIPSTSGIDTVPAMLSGGEFVMNRSAVQSIGAPNLQSMNAGGTSIASEETSKELNEKLLAKLDELIGASGSTGNITINVAPSGQTSQETSQDPSASRQQLARQIKDAVLQIINDEKRIGGSLRR